VGPNTKSFSNALRSALREDPDIILVGEMRDLETISLALTAAETGHLVFGTLHTQSAPKTCDRIIDVFPPEQQKLVRVMFAESFQAIVCQQLLRKKNGDGRVAALEIMLGTAASRSLIRDGKTHQLPTIIQTSGKLGMQSLDQNLKELLMRGIISERDAVAKANNPNFVVPNGEEMLEQMEHMVAQPQAGVARQPGAPNQTAIGSGLYQRPRPGQPISPIAPGQRPMPGRPQQAPQPAARPSFPFMPKK
jgi:type II secretory ATPase GspE/PulE/Tfp pilus assembly ATPase PilB-like protein